MQLGNFLITDENSLNNSSLLRVLPGIKEERIKELFGRIPEIWDEDYKPYTEKIVVLHIPSRERYCVYAYAGQWRIGGVLSNKNVKELEILITKNN